LIKEENSDVKKKIPARCLVCNKTIDTPAEENQMNEDEFICNACLEETLSSLEDAWKRQSAFLDAALN